MCWSAGLILSRTESLQPPLSTDLEWALRCPYITRPPSSILGQQRIAPPISNAPPLHTRWPRPRREGTVVLWLLILCCRWSLEFCLSLAPKLSIERSDELMFSSFQNQKFLSGDDVVGNSVGGARYDGWRADTDESRFLCGW